MDTGDYVELTYTKVWAAAPTAKADGLATVTVNSDGEVSDGDAGWRGAR